MEFRVHDIIKVFWDSSLWVEVSWVLVDTGPKITTTVMDTRYSLVMVLSRRVYSGVTLLLFLSS